MKKTIKRLFLVFGIYFIVLGILAFINAFINREYTPPFWFCYFALLLIGGGILYRNSNLILVQLNILLIPTIFWNVDFFYQLITGNSLWGITDYFFATNGISSLGDFVSLQHIYIVPISLFLIYIIGTPKKGLWKWSLLEMAIIFIISYLFTSVEDNVNCVFKSCVDFISIEGIYYYLFWFLIVFSMLFLTNFIITKIIGKLKERNR